MPNPCPSEVNNAIVKLKRYKSPSSDQISAELIQARSETLGSDIYKLNNRIWNTEELSAQWKGPIIVLIYKEGKTDCSKNRGISLLQLNQNCIQYHSLKANGINSVGYQIRSTTDQGFFFFFCISHIMEKTWECNKTVHGLFTDFKRGYD
jgi:hypothetical protein